MTLAGATNLIALMTDVLLPEAFFLFKEWYLVLILSALSNTIIPEL